MWLDPTADHAYMNTINRAEMCGICEAVRATLDRSDRAELHIYTDSQVSISLIRKYMFSPIYSAVAENKHSALLQRIADAIILRAEMGAHTRFFKVRSHVGVEGNERADQIAGEAAKGTTPGQLRVCDGRNDDPHGTRVWAAARPKPPPQREGPPETKKQKSAEPRPRYLSNLGKAARTAVAPTAAAGPFQDKGLYATLWTKARPTHDGETSGSFLRDPGVTWAQKRKTMLARWGLLWNQKLAHRYGKAPTDSCPQCGQPDSVGHLLGGCDETQGIRTARHDQAVKIIQRAISKGALQGRFTIMDAGAAEDLPEDVAGKRLPEWLFQQGQDRLTGVCLRPDILLVSCPSLDKTRPGDERKAPPEREEAKTIHIIEVGYSSDLSMDIKESEKHRQHEELEKLLKRGNPEGTVTRHTIILGRTGAIPASLFTLLGAGVGLLPKPKIQQVGRKLCKHAVQFIEKFTWARQAAAAPRQNNHQHNHQPGGKGETSSSSSSPSPRPQPAPASVTDRTSGRS
jgi:ribonuclease HI